MPKGNIKDFQKWMKSKFLKEGLHSSAIAAYSVLDTALPKIAEVKKERIKIKKSKEGEQEEITVFTDYQDEEKSNLFIIRILLNPTLPFSNQLLEVSAFNPCIEVWDKRKDKSIIFIINKEELEEYEKDFSVILSDIKKPEGNSQDMDSEVFDISKFNSFVLNSFFKKYIERITTQVIKQIADLSISFELEESED